MDKLSIVYQNHDQEYDIAQRFIGTSVFRTELLIRIRRYAELKAPVLICGESGTGKELVAGAIHELSGARSGPFIPLNCGAVPESLAESELFGHTRGAFTGAVNSQPGICEQAAGGSLFLDEIGELPLTIQSKFLRFLEDGTMRRLGDEKTSFVRTRIIAATNRPLESLVSSGIGFTRTELRAMDDRPSYRACAERSGRTTQRAARQQSSGDPVLPVPHRRP